MTTYKVVESCPALQLHERCSAETYDQSYGVEISLKIADVDPVSHRKQTENHFFCSSWSKDMGNTARWRNSSHSRLSRYWYQVASTSRAAMTFWSKIESRRGFYQFCSVSIQKSICIKFHVEFSIQMSHFRQVSVKASEYGIYVTHSM